MSHGELIASPGITGQSTGLRQRNLRIITDTLPSFTDQQSSETARENMSRLDPFTDPACLYDGLDAISGTSIPYVFTPARVLISNDTRFKFFPPEQAMVTSKPINSTGPGAQIPSVATKLIPFISEEPPAFVQPRPLQSEMISPCQNGESQNKQQDHKPKTQQVQSVECKKNSAPKEEIVCRDDLRRMIRTLSKTERDALMQLLSQELASEDKVAGDTRVAAQPVKPVEGQGSNVPSMVTDLSTQNAGCTTDQLDSLVNSDVSHTHESHQRQAYMYTRYDTPSTSEQVSFSVPPSFQCSHPHCGRTWPSMQATGSNYAVHDSPIIVDIDTNYVVPNAPKVYMNESASHFTPHSGAQCRFTGIGLASSTFDRRRPRPTFRATIYEDSPKAPKAFTEQDDNIILASIFYYVGDYNTTDLNWHIIYYYYSLLIYNDRTLSSLRSRFHKYLKMDFKFDIKDYSLSYWLDTLELCVSTMQHSNVPITQRGELCNAIATRKNKVHYLVACIFVFLRPDMQYNELKHNFCIWLELINGPHRFI